MAGLQTYAELIAEVLERVEPNAEPSASRMALLVKQAEDMVYRTLRHRKMEKQSSLTATDGEVPLPDDFIEIISAFQDTEEMTHLASRTALPQMRHDRWYYLLGGTLYTNAASFTLRYYHRPLSLTDLGQTSLPEEDRYLMLREESELWLNATLLQVYMDMGMVEPAAVALAAMNATIQAVNGLAQEARSTRRRMDYGGGYPRLRYRHGGRT